MKNYIFRLLSFLYSYELNRKIRVASNLIYSSWLCNFFKHTGHKVKFNRPIYLANPQNVSIGDKVHIKGPMRLETIVQYEGQHFTPEVNICNNVVINAYCHIGCINKIHIGDYTTIAERCMIMDHTHGQSTLEDLSLHTYARPLVSKGPVIIEECVQIGEGCIILPNVTIGKHSIIGANSVVTKSVPPYSIAGGNPARIIKSFSETSNIDS